jgi:hypothetical protein
MKSLLPAVVGTLLAAASAAGTTDLHRGDPAPLLVMQSIDGRRIDTNEMGDRVLLLLFGEAGQDKTHRACREVATALEAKRLSDEPIDWILILSKSSRIVDLDLDAIKVDPPPIVVHDTARSAFGAYKTLVVPTAVVVGRDGNVVHAMASYTNRFGDIVFDALSVAVGSLSVEEFEQRRGGPTASCTSRTACAAGGWTRWRRRSTSRRWSLPPACHPPGWGWGTCFCVSGGSMRRSTSFAPCSPPSRKQRPRRWASRSCSPIVEAPSWTRPTGSRASSSSTTAPGPGPTFSWA